MGVKFNRRIKLGKHVNINIGKKGLNSVSFKVGRTTINPMRNTFSYNSRVKGLSYQGKLADTNKGNNGMEEKELLIKLAKEIQNFMDIIKEGEEIIIQYEEAIEKGEQMLREETEINDNELQQCRKLLEEKREEKGEIEKKIREAEETIVLAENNLSMNRYEIIEKANSTKTNDIKTNNNDDTFGLFTGYLLITIIFFLWIIIVAMCRS